MKCILESKCHLIIQLLWLTTSFYSVSAWSVARLQNNRVYHVQGKSSLPCGCERTTMLNASIGDFLAGVSGVAPKSLNPPLSQILAGTSIDPNKENVDVKCVYKASRDGWSAADFHKCCDGRGSGLVVCLSKNGKKFGGFNPLGWMGTDDYGTTNSAFLWFLQGTNVKKCRVLPGGNAAVFDYATGGPKFGAEDLTLGSPLAPVMGGFAGPDMENTKLNAGDMRRGSSVVGGAYDFVQGWPVGGKFSLTEVEVYCNANIKPSQPRSSFRFF